MNKKFQFNNLTVQVTSGKFGEYRYKSPRYGYKRAYRYDKIITIDVNDEQIIRFPVKNWRKSDLTQYLNAISEFINNRDFSNMVARYNQAHELHIDYGYVRELAKTK
jgi:hypothetical protein